MPVHTSTRAARGGGDSGGDVAGIDNSNRSSHSRNHGGSSGSPGGFKGDCEIVLEPMVPMAGAAIAAADKNPLLCSYCTPLDANDFAREYFCKQ